MVRALPEGQGVAAAGAGDARFPQRQRRAVSASHLRPAAPDPSNHPSQTPLTRAFRSNRSRSLADAVFKGRTLARGQMQPMLGSTVQHIGGMGRPLGLAQVARFPLIKIAAEVAPKIRAGA